MLLNVDMSQGSVHVPLFFCIYIYFPDVLILHNSFVSHFTNNFQIFDLPPKFLSQILDLYIQMSIQISTQLSYNHLKLNLTQTKQIIQPVLQPFHTIEGTNILAVAQSKILGVISDSLLFFTPHIRSLTNSCDSAIKIHSESNYLLPPPLLPPWSNKPGA